MSDYTTAQELFDALSAPFPSDAIDWRIGSTTKDKKKGMALAYIDARTVADRLDALCGMDGWQCNYTQGVNGSIVCNIGILVPGDRWIWKADGAGATDYEGEKGALSDAFKRAAVRFGVGRYLYGMNTPWVELDDKQRIPPAEKKKLDEHHEDMAKRIGWGGPADVSTYRFLLRIVQETVTQPSDAHAFREKYKSMFPLLRVAARRHLEENLDRIGGQQEAA